MVMPQHASDRQNLRLTRSPHVQLAVVVSLLLLISVPLIVRGSDLGLQSMFNAPLMWVDRDSEARRPFNAFLELFGAHDLIVVSWPGCDVDDVRLPQAAERLERIDQSRIDAAQETLFNHVLTGKTMLDSLTSPPINLSRGAAAKRLRGVVVGDDGKTSGIVIELTEYGAIERRETIALIKEAVSNATEVPQDELIMSGPAIDGMAIDNESMRSINTYSIPSIVISAVLCWICLRSIWLTVPILIVGAWAQGLMLAAVYYAGETMNAILIVLPALVFVLSVSIGIHLAHYFLEELDAGQFLNAPRRAIRKAMVPCLLAAITTAIGLASLGISSVEPVRQFGYLGAIGVLTCLALLFMLLPGFMLIYLKVSKPSDDTSAAEAAGTADTAEQTVGGQSTTQFTFGWIAAVINRQALAIRLLCLLAMIGCGVGLLKLRTTIDVISLLSEDNRAVQDFHWIENNIGPLVPIDVVIHFDRDSNVDEIDRLKIIAAVQDQIGEIENLHGTISAVTYIPAFPRLRGVGSTIRKTVFLRQIEQSRQELIDAHYLAVTEDGEYWRIGARIRGQAHFDYGEFLDQVQAKVDFVLEKADAAGFQGVSSSSTGVLVLVYRIQKLLLADLFQSFITALVLVAIVMMIALRSIPGGLIAMLPNVFPTTILFGVMGWAEHAIDIGTVMTASVALGIAVDGTFHFIKWFLHASGEGATKEQAIAIAYRRCGGALIQTTIICACGLLIYSFSGFLPVRHFAWVLMMMLIVALFGDLVLLPALLAGKLGDLLRRAALRLG